MSYVMVSDVNQYMFIELSNPRKNISYNTRLFFILNELIGSCATALAKYAIIQLPVQGIPAISYKGFYHWYDDDIYNHCQEIVNERRMVQCQKRKDARL